MSCFVTVLCLVLSLYGCVALESPKCDVRARTEWGVVCGLRRWAEDGSVYASFRGVPYAKQPLGPLRFKELQPAEPWDHELDATEEGPICMQHDEIYGEIATPKRGMSEACIYANVHVPIAALPQHQRVTEDQDATTAEERRGLPILVFVHGGGFQSGSGDTDMHGPEYLVWKGIIVITFNYRLNALGFLSLNSASIPGNNGLRDMVTLLRWVQRNARSFGGDPADVTLAGQSAGAASAHLLSLSKATEGLFKRVILISGTAIPAFYTASPAYAKFVADQFLNTLGINNTDAEAVHQQLVDMPIERINKANSIIQFRTGLITFAPVVETPYPGVTTIIDKEPLEMIDEGRGKELPFLMSFTNNESLFFKFRLNYLDILGRILANPALILSPGLIFSLPSDVSTELAEKVRQKYFGDEPTMEKFLEICSNTFFVYPTMNLTRWRVQMGAAPTYLYQYAYESDFNVVKKGIALEYKGAAHVEDLTQVFRTNSVLGGYHAYPPLTKDDQMKDWMTDIIVNFMKCSDPSCNKAVSQWPPAQSQQVLYQNIETPRVYHYTEPTDRQKDMLNFYDMIYQRSRDVIYSN